jgi:O-antigen ligase
VKADIVMKRGKVVLIVILSAFIAGLLLNSWISTLMVWIFSATVVAYFVVNFFVKKNKKLFFHPLFVFSVLIFLVKLLYFLFSDEKFAMIESSLPLLIFPVIFFLLPPDKQVFEAVCKISVLSYLLITLSFIGSFSFWFFTTNMNFYEFMYHKRSLYTNYLTYPFFEHPTFFSLNLCLIFPLIFVATNAIKMQKRKSLVLIILISAVIIFATWLTGSRSGFLVAGIISVTLLLSQLNFNLMYKFGILFFAAIALYFSTSVFGVNIHDSTRKEMLEQAKYKIREKPFLGNGIGRLEYSVEIYDHNGKHYHPHNQFYSELVKQGFVGALPLFLFIVAVIITTLYKKFNWLLFFWLLVYFPLMWIDAPLEYYGGISLSFWLCFFITNRS